MVDLENVHIPTQGKCDFRDTLFMISTDGTEKGINEYLSKADIYIWDNKTEDKIKLDIKTMQDAIPYMFHLIASSSYSKDTGSTIFLTASPYHNYEEQQTLEWRLDTFKKFCKWHKKNGVKFTFDNLCKYARERYEAPYTEIYKNLFSQYYFGNHHVSLEGLHTARYNRLREELLEFAEYCGCDMNHPELLKYKKEIEEYNKMLS